MAMVELEPVPEEDDVIGLGRAVRPLGREKVGNRHPEQGRRPGEPVKKATASESVILTVHGVPWFRV